MTILRGAAVTLIATGAAVLALLAWQLWGTDVATAQAQRDASDALTTQWQAPPVSGPPNPGDPIARLRIPSIGVDQVVIEGADDAQLADGPGHYPGTAGPGEAGDFAVAGHRVTHGGPFGRLDELHTCDVIEVEDRGGVWTYRVLPVVGEANPCGLSDVAPGRQIVTPDRGDVLDPIAGHRLLTLTTCHPKYSAQQRLIIRAELIAR